MDNERQQALRHLAELRLRARELDRAGVDALRQQGLTTLEAVIEEEHANLQEQRAIMKTLLPDKSSNT